MPDASTNKVEPILDTGLDDEDPQSNDIVNPDGEERVGHVKDKTSSSFMAKSSCCFPYL
ncbi:hypothetical protein JHK87_055645 [Glycine soja]|nr:hypothetical protein JHK87_055645 [Glycine soja]